MIANLEHLLPGALVLLDVPGVRRGDRAIVLRQVEAPLGDSVTVEVCVGPCTRQQHSTDCPAVGFHPDELLLVPADAAAPLYACCEHIGREGCPAGCAGHPAPCTKCGQPLKDNADARVARAMNAADRGSVAVVAVLLACVAGSLLFLALLAAGRHGMCALHDQHLRYCPGFTTTTSETR